VRAELVRHRDILGDRLEFYLLLNKMRWYLVYLRKSHNPWAGGTEFARGINAEAGRYRAELGGFFSRCDRLRAEDGQAAVDAPRGARRLDPDALGKEPEAAAGALNR